MPWNLHVKILWFNHAKEGCNVRTIKAFLFAQPILPRNKILFSHTPCKSEEILDFWPFLSDSVNIWHHNLGSDGSDNPSTGRAVTFWNTRTLKHRWIHFRNWVLKVNIKGQLFFSAFLHGLWYLSTPSNKFSPFFPWAFEQTALSQLFSLTSWQIQFTETLLSEAVLFISFTVMPVLNVRFGGCFVWPLWLFSFAQQKFYSV